jgi:hypothetical protein
MTTITTEQLDAHNPFGTHKFELMVQSIYISTPTVFAVVCHPEVSDSIMMRFKTTRQYDEELGVDYIKFNGMSTDEIAVALTALLNRELTARIVDIEDQIKHLKNVQVGYISRKKTGLGHIQRILKERCS